VRVEVEAYSGYRADERPLRFRLGDRWHVIEEVVDRWYDPDAVYFRIRSDDGAMYILRHLDGSDLWTLEAYRRA
jgi:hypothetical protein